MGSALGNGGTVDFKAVIGAMAAVRGTLACGVADYESGMLLDGQGANDVELEVMAAGNTDIMRAEVKAIRLLDNGQDGEEHIEDMLTTLSRQYYLLRPMQSCPGLFLFSVLDKSKANLALARRALKEADKAFGG